MFRRAAAAFVTVGVVAGASVLLSGEAMAAPRGCTLSHNSAAAAVVCQGGTGQYRVTITCHDGISGTNYHGYGPWVSPPEKSKATCPAPQRQRLTAWDYQIR